MILLPVKSIVGILSLIMSCLVGSWTNCDTNFDNNEEKKIKVTILVIFASETETIVHEKLKEIGKELQKKEPKLKGFRLEKSISVTIAVDKTETVKLCEKADLEITISSPQEQNGKYTVKIKPPTLGEITYSCSCNKFFPIITNHITAAPKSEKLILAVMTKPCDLTKSCE